MNSSFIFRRPNSSKTDAFRSADLLSSTTQQSQMFMIVDDSRFLLDCLKLTAEKFLNAEVDTYLSPVEAWNAFLRNPEDYRGVITDFQMPEMTGADLIQRIRARFTDVPIVLMSAEAEPEEADLGSDLFARFVRKPFDWKDVVTQFEELESTRR